jgi:tRNA threonylcarbamoyladenosine modification (KEOPS) complex Cgi121 subunit
MTNIKDSIIKSVSSQQDVTILVAKAKALSKKNAVVQLFNPDSIISRKHLMGAYENARITFSAKENISKSMAMEMLLFAAMTRQIGDAVERVGIKSPRHFVIFSNSQKAYFEFKGLLETAAEFKPTASQSRVAARRWGFKESKDLDSELLQKIALSRIG